MSFNDMLSPDADRLIREAQDGQARLLTAAPAPVYAHSIPPLSAYVGSDVGSCGNEFCSHPWCIHRRFAYEGYRHDLQNTVPCPDPWCRNDHCLELREIENYYEDEQKTENTEHARWLYCRRQNRIRKLRAKRLAKREGLALIRLSALFAFSDDF